MPPLPAVANVIKTVLKGTSGEATELPWANILHWAFSGASPTEAFLSTLGGIIASEWSTHMAPEQVSNTTLTEIDLYDLTSNTAASAGVFPDVVGTRGDDELPAQVAYLVDYPIARRYRGGHPRTYLYVLGVADFLDAAHWSSAATTEVATHWAAFLNAILGYSASGVTINTLVNVSYVDRNVNPVPPYRRAVPLVDDINLSFMTGHQQMASQRRRNGRHRR